MDTVRLKYAASESFSPGGGVTGVRSTKVSAKIKKFALANDVTLVFTQGDGVWNQTPLSFARTFDDHDIFETDDNTIVITQFALQYSAGADTFWDNNNGADYRVETARPNTVGGNVVLNSATAKRGTQAGGGLTFTTSWVEGEIWVKDLSFAKRVGMRLSTNNWASFVDTPATFNSKVPTNQGLSQVEIWGFKTPELNLDNTTPSFVFAVFYENLNTGEWFWDNNCGQDFRLSKADGASTE
jgi:hypothetical protein